LRRTVSGPFSLADAVTLEALQAMDEPARDLRLLPPDAPLAGVARLDVDATTAQALVAGRLGVSPRDAAGIYRCYGPQGRFLGLIESAGGALRSLRLARTDTPAEP
jgi:tRNA pseudouridine55 synthase